MPDLRVEVRGHSDAADVCFEVGMSKNFHNFLQFEKIKRFRQITIFRRKNSYFSCVISDLMSYIF